MCLTFAQLPNHTLMRPFVTIYRAGLILLLVATYFPSTSHAQFLFGAPQSMTFEAVNGGSAVQACRITVNAPIDQIAMVISGPEASQFEIVSENPIKFRTDTTINPIVSIRFTPVPAIASANAELTLSAMGVSQKVALIGRTIEPKISDTLSCDFFAAGAQQVTFSDMRSGDRLWLRVFNNSNAPIKLVDFHLQTGTAFRVQLGGAFGNVPVTIPPGAYVELRVDVLARDNGVYSDNLILITEDGLSEISVKFVGNLGVPLAVGEDNTSSGELVVYPNPTSGSARVSVANAQRVSYQLIDQLGNVVLAESSPTFVTSQMLPSGAYTVRALVVGADGQQFTRTSRLVSNQ
jgi:hypothetical protein